MAERKMGPMFYGEGKSPVGWKDGEYVEYYDTVAGMWRKATTPVWDDSDQYRLKASHPYYTLDDAATLERLKESYPGLVWPELPDRTDVIVDGWFSEWQKSRPDDKPTWYEGTARFIARKLITDGVLK